MTRRRLKDEAGVALVVAVMVTMLMLLAGMALLSFVDQQATQSGRERVKESSLTLAEAVLNAETSILPARWPGTPATAFAPCNQASTALNCPNSGDLLRSFTGNTDIAGATPTWSLTIRDNGLGSYYDDTATQNQPAYDASGPGGVPDNLLWVRAQAAVRGRTKTLVALVRASTVGQNFPRSVITAGHFKTTNNGNKTIVDTGSGPGVVVRCSAGAGGPGRGNSCLDYVATKGQVWPNSYTADTATPNAMSPTEVAALRARAKAGGTWYSTCPATLPSAPVVFVETGPCDGGANSPTAPGILVINSGTYSIGAGDIFYGIIYCVNTTNLTGDVITIGGTALIKGAAVVDGAGGISAGSSAVNLIWDPNVFSVVEATASVAILANSWRELNGS
ncbi:MAG: hypothetical protein QOG41_2501 [Thermoleophilaceae bacterium]|jgi:Tfp pilus assembly protein PilX|nr:hypothetical protein [Thermoleophilaceae bacterium]